MCMGVKKNNNLEKEKMVIGKNTEDGLQDT